MSGFPGSAWGGSVRVFPAGYPERLGLYLALQAAVFLAPGAWPLAPGMVLFALGHRAGIRWGRWISRLGALLGIVLLPALAGLPEACGSLGEGTAAFLSAWAPALRRSLVFLLVLAGAEWLSRTTRVSEIRDALEWALRPFGKRGKDISLTAALALSFLPWARNELRRADEASRLRGSDPRRRPLRHLAALALPLTARLLEKVRSSSEALALRYPDREDGPAFRGAGSLQGASDLGGQGGHQG